MEKKTTHLSKNYQPSPSKPPPLHFYYFLPGLQPKISAKPRCRWYGARSRERTRGDLFGALGPLEAWGVYPAGDGAETPTD